MTTPNPILSGVDQSTINTLAAQAPQGAGSTPAAQSAQPSQPAQPAAPPAQTTHTGSMFRKILSVGLMALAGGMAAEGASGPGPAAAEGVQFGVQRRQQQLENVQRQQQIGVQQQQAATEQQRANTEQGQLALGQQQLAEQTKLDQANIALSHAKLIQAQKEIALLPADRQQQIEQDIGLPMAKNLVAAGAQIVGSDFDNYTDAFSQALKLQGSTQNMAVWAAPIVGSEDKDGNLKYGVYELPTGVLQTPISIQYGKQNITVPAGVPRTQAGAIIADGVTRAIMEETQLGVAGLNAQSRTNVAQIEAQSRARVQALRNQSPQELAASYKTASDSVAALNKQIGDAQQQLNSLGSLMSPERDQINATISGLQDQLGAAQQEQYAAYYLLHSGGTSPAPAKPGAAASPNTVPVGAQPGLDKSGKVVGYMLNGVWHDFGGGQ